MCGVRAGAWILDACVCVCVAPSRMWRNGQKPLAFNRHHITRIRGFVGIFEKSSESQSPECRSKIDAIKCIDEWIHCAVQPSQPREHRAQCLVNAFTGQKGFDQVANEKWQPAHDEAADHDAQRLRGFVLTFQRQDAIGQ